LGKGIAVSLGAVAAIAVIAIVVFMAVMMIVMMGTGMMGTGMFGGGSDPSDEAAVEGVTQVRLENIAFSPANIIVDAGTTVTWTNYDSAGHTVTSDDGDDLKSPLVGQNGTFSRTFDVPGEYYYHCEPHPWMEGLVTVRPN